MTLIIISIPLMILAVAIAVVPLLVMSHVDHRLRQEEAIRSKRLIHGEAATDDDAAIVPWAA
jgi:hypothetical protein